MPLIWKENGLRLAVAGPLAGSKGKLAHAAGTSLASSANNAAASAIARVKGNVRANPIATRSAAGACGVVTVVAVADRPAGAGAFPATTIAAAPPFGAIAHATAADALAAMRIGPGANIDASAAVV